MAATLLELLSAEQSQAGQALGAVLGISRAAVWKQVAALRALGVPVLSDARGYRLAWPADPLDETAIRHGLKTAGAPACAVDLVDTVDSTSDALWRQHRAGDSTPRVLLSEHQSGARGRRGRQWSSPWGAQLCLSVRWRLLGGIADAQGLSIMLGVAAWRALNTLGIEGVTLKWPNDLLGKQGKLGGILVEASGELTGPCTVVAGIGINVRMPPDWQVDQASSDLYRHCEGRLPTSRNALAIAVCEQWLPVLADARGELQAYLDDWARADALKGKAVRVDLGNDKVDGTALGIDADGRLRVQTPAGERCYSSAEVSVRAQ